MRSALLDDHALSSYLGRGAVASLIAHVLMVLLVAIAANVQPDARAFLPAPVMVSFVPPEERDLSSSAAARQIVSPSERSSDLPPPDDSFLSERDSSVERQQIKRGDGEDAGNPGQQPGGAPAVASRAVKNSPDQKQKIAESRPAPHALKDIALDQRTLLQDFSAAEQESSEDRLRAAISGQMASAPVTSLASIQPFSRITGTGARFMGTRGNTDFLPTLPDGDITLLNAKANLFAVFVRRVAVQVFSNLRSSGWDRLGASDIRGMSKDTTVKALLSKEGTLLGVTLAEESGSVHFDQVLHDAVQRGARDPNPPAGAALEDGNIHLVFKARSWVQYAGDPRTGAPSERRWLVLGTGLE